MTTLSAHAGRARRTWSSAFLLTAALLLACLGAAAPAFAAHGRHAASRRSPAAHSAALVRASRKVRAADRALVRNARALARCHALHRSCLRRQAALQRAGARLAAAQQHLAGVASSRGGAQPHYYETLRRAPDVSVRGDSLSWNATAGVHAYVLERSVPGQRVQDSLVYATGVTPPPVPGQTVSYRVRTATWGSEWSTPVSISYPAPTSSPPPVQAGDPQAAPALTVSGETLSWQAVAGIATYVLDTKVPGRRDSYSEVSGTSYAPPAVAGTTVRYALRTAVEGSSWSSEVSISFPAAPAAPETPTETSPGSPVATGSGTVFGVDTGGWVGSLIGELSSAGIGNLRVQSQAAVTVAAEAPGHIGSIVFGGGGAIGTINPTTYAAEVLTVSTLTHPRAIEVLNEPNNPGFWSDTTNYSAYAKLAKAVHEALQTLPAALRPAELCSWDGGEGPSSSWGAAIKAAGALNYCDGVTVHPYGGSKGQDGGALGGRRDVELAHANSGMPVYITEIGWPTAVGQPSTGDSQQWTEAQQAENMKNFATWAQQTGYVPMVTFFNAVDYGTNSFYGIETSSRKHKQSYATLAELSA